MPRIARPRFLLACVLVSSLNAAAARAQSPYQSNVTSRPPPASASATSVDGEEASELPRTSPNDLLRAVPGLLTSQHQGGAKADQLFVRGFDADHGSDVAIFVDGVPVNLPSHAHGQGYADLHWLIPEAIARIDVEKGSYDVRWGDFATAASVNLITRDRFAGSSVQYTVGGFPTLAGKVVEQGRFVGIVAPSLPHLDKLHPWIAFEAAYDDGPFTNSLDLRRYNLFAKLGYDVSPHLAIGLFVEAYGSGWRGSGQIPERDVTRIGRFGSEDPSEGGQTERQMVTAFARYHSGHHQLDATVYVTRYRLALYNDFTFYLGDPVHGDEQEQDDARVFAGGKLVYTLRRRWHHIVFRTTVGADSRYDTAGVQRWHDTSHDGAFRERFAAIDNDGIDLLDLAAYAEEDAVFTRWLRVVAGVRLDYIALQLDDRITPAGSGTRQLSVPSPKLSIIFSPLRHLELYLDFGQGFHTNMAAVALLDGKMATAPDGSRFVLHAVPRYWTGEVGARLRLDDRIEATGALWASYIENETVFDTDVAAFVPSDPVRRLGFDLGLRARVTDWLHVDFELSNASATSVPSGTQIALAPRLYMTGGLSTAWRGLRAGLRFRYLGERPLFDEGSLEWRTTRERDRVVAQPWLVVDLYASWRWRFLELGIAIQNLFDSDWREAQLGNSSCTYAETFDRANANYKSCGSTLANRPGVVDNHFTPGVPFNPQLTAKFYF